MSKVERFNTREELFAAHPDAQDHTCGPIHKVSGVDYPEYKTKTEDKYYVQVYAGQHEWISINVEDTSERYNDPGWDGKEYGWGFVPYDSKNFWPKSSVLEISPPERDGKPLTEDAILFMDKDKLLEYLGPEDPVTKSFKK